MPPALAHLPFRFASDGEAEGGMTSGGVARRTPPFWAPLPPTRWEPLDARRRNTVVQAVEVSSTHLRLSSLRMGVSGNSNSPGSSSEGLGKRLVR
jgi:hypothetical protein